MDTRLRQRTDESKKLTHEQTNEQESFYTPLQLIRGHSAHLSNNSRVSSQRVVKFQEKQLGTVMSLVCGTFTASSDVSILTESDPRLKNRWKKIKSDEYEVNRMFSSSNEMKKCTCKFFFRQSLEALRIYKLFQLFRLSKIYRHSLFIYFLCTQVPDTGKEKAPRISIIFQRSNIIGLRQVYCVCVYPPPPYTFIYTDRLHLFIKDWQWLPWCI